MDENTTPSVHIRRATRMDFSAISAICAEAMMDDDIFAPFYPRRREYFSDFRDEFLRQVKLWSVTPGYVLQVAISAGASPEDQGGMQKRREFGTEKVVSFCAWERRGENATSRDWREENQGFLCSMSSQILDSLGPLYQHGFDMYPCSSTDDSLFFLITTTSGTMSLYYSLCNRYVNSLNLNRSVDQELASRFPEYDPFSTFPVFSEQWHVSLIVVDPARQRRGLGRMMMDWGMEQARKENVAVGLETGKKGREFYEKLGFRILTVNNWMEDYQEVVMVREPEGRHR